MCQGFRVVFLKEFFRTLCPHSTRRKGLPGSPRSAAIYRQRASKAIDVRSIVIDHRREVVATAHIIALGYLQKVTGMADDHPREPLYLGPDYCQGSQPPCLRVRE